ncbi:MAG: hypothetical protein CMJ75_18875 [Planctomycetaceae bacterium]|nr:hypothetical protein [Planctomycetaceae bacterium]
MKIVVVEPHADDAILSMGGHIERWVKDGDPVTILTVYGNPKRDAEAKAYAEAVGASHIALGLAEGTPLEEHAGEFVFPEDTVLIFPIGIQHPDHIEVASLADEDDWRYLDQPYGSKVGNAEEVIEKTTGLAVHSLFRPHARKYRHVKLFKTQSKFFYYNDPKVLAMNLEVVFRA